MRRLPPLNALRAFEAAARHLSFRAAADELSVTPAAVSHQIKALEAHLGTRLFQRGIRQVKLTRAGQSLHPGLAAGFDRLAEAVARTRQEGPARHLTVTVAPSIAARWLVPRVERFTASHPGLDLRITGSTTLVDFARDDVDVALRYGPGRYPGLYSELLLVNDVFPVCTPAVAAGPPPLKTPDDLRHVPLLHEVTVGDDPSLPDWTMWLAASGATGVDASRGVRLDRPTDVTEAALAGAGVALAKSALVADDLAAGRLVRPFDLTLRANFAYYFVCTPAALTRPEVQAFRSWVTQEARDTPGTAASQQATAAAAPPPKPKAKRRR